MKIRGRELITRSLVYAKSRDVRGRHADLTNVPRGRISRRSISAIITVRRKFRENAQDEALHIFLQRVQLHLIAKMPNDKLSK